MAVKTNVHLNNVKRAKRRVVWYTGSRTSALVELVLFVQCVSKTINKSEAKDLLNL